MEQQLSLRRPRLLVAAARHGLARYDRVRDLPRLFRDTLDQALPAEPLAALREAEHALDTARRDGEAHYLPSRHVAVLVALLAELTRGDQP